MTDLVKRETAEVVERPEATTLLQLIAQAARDPNIDVTKMERLYAMHKELAAEQRRADFDAALATVQAQLPQFSKTSKAKNSMYAALEDIDRVTKPLLTAAGFSQTCTEDSSTETTATFVFTLSRAGHEKSVRKTFSIDRAAKNASGASIRPAIQDDGSTIHYATRYLLKMILGIVEKDADTDGEDLAKLTDDEAKDLEIAAKEAYGSDFNRFLVYMHVGSVSEILKRDAKKAAVAIDAKREDTEKKKR